jgi:SAM-dependent methyltransferase
MTGALPFGTAELLAAVPAGGRVLEAGCGSGRLAVALALRGDRVTAFDASAARVADARRRAADAGVRVDVLEADIERELPFAAAEYSAAVSRLVLMIPGEPATALARLARCVAGGGVIATAVWARADENPWFAEPRAAVAAVLGPERAAFARAFGRLGESAELAAVHRQAGLVDIAARRLEGELVVADAEAHWATLSAENGHFRRVAAALDESTTSQLLQELAARLERFRAGDALHLPRAMILAVARVPGPTSDS